MVKVQDKNKTVKITTRSGRFHIGLCQSGGNISAKLPRLVPTANVVVHNFDTSEELHAQFQRSYIDILILSAMDDPSWLSDMVRKIKSQAQLQFIPLMVYAPGAGKDLIINCLIEGADDITIDEWDDELMPAKAMMLVSRTQRDLGVNPSSRLPGANAIEFEIDKRIHNNEKFAVCYADVDNFKAYNDYYGYMYGDKTIRITSHIIRTVVQDLAPDDGFVGHIGGDDFVFIIPPEKVENVCQNVISTFDRMAPFRYDEADRERGWIEVANRKGEMERFPVFTISIAVIINQKRMFKHPGEMSHMMADLKKYTKTLPGSNYMIERRRKY
ncbi:MAG: diguanylate cyclase [Candidatus Zixiibacteriota bacterium]|nr:MAG: diguanylate cyclase [candidate division Zixibacteria bacterium]UCE67334.1 MAG: diguanylate cyclase [candidate division Zixibacteria bacterium]